MQFFDHFPLRDYVSLQTGGVAEYFVTCSTLRDFIEAATEASQRQVPYQVLGRGRGVLVSDAGYPGLVIHNKTAGIHFMHERSQVIVESGMPLSHLLSLTLSRGYSGLEFLTGMDETIGAAVYGNTSRFGHQLGDYVRSATLLFPKSTDIKRVDRDWFRFRHRSTRLRDLRHGHPLVSLPIIMSVTLQLSKMDTTNCLKKMQYFSAQKAPAPALTDHALEVFESLYFTDAAPKSRHPRLMDVPVYVVERAALRNLPRSTIMASPLNPNFILNQGLGTSAEAHALIEKLQALVADQGALVPQIEYMGLWDKD